MSESMTNYNYAFVGNLSCDYNGEELKCLRKHVSNHFNADGGMVITYSKKHEVKGIDYLSKLWGLDIRTLNNNGRVVLICRDDYVVNNRINVQEIIESIKDGLDFLNNNGSKSNMVYITIDSFWQFCKDEDYEFAYNTMKSISKKEGTKFLLRYITKELNQEQLFYLLRSHEYILVDGVDDFEVYTPGELIYNSLVLKSEYNLIYTNYKKEMKRIEHLKVLGELMESTVHDINNLLTTISGYAQLSLATDDLVDIESYLNIINKTTLDGRNVIDKIRYHISGSYKSEKKFYRIDDIVKSCILMTEYNFKNGSTVNGGQLRMNVDLNSQGYIYANEYEIRQSILNLILNGVESMDNGGILTIKSYDINGQIFLEVKDTGKGIDEKTINKIFDSHFTTKGSKGTGLGLNMVKSIVKDYDGAIDVDSKFGQGTKFTICFPISEPEYLVAEVGNKGYNFV